MIALAAITTQEVTLSSATRWLSVLVAVGFLALVLELVRRHKLQERYTVAWFAAALAMLALAAFPQLLTTLASVAGITDTNAALFSFGFVVGGLLLLNLTVVVSRQSTQITRLAQENALLRLEHSEDTNQSPPRAGNVN